MTDIHKHIKHIVALGMLLLLFGFSLEALAQCGPGSYPSGVKER